DVVVLSAFAFSNNYLLILYDIGEQYDTETREGIIGRNFNGQYNSSFHGEIGYFENEKWNLYMGAGALGAAVNDYAADNFDHTDLDFIGGGAIELRKYGFAAISCSNNYFIDTHSWGAEYNK